MDLKNQRLSDDNFQKIREEVLQTWPTGKDVNFDEAVTYQKNIPTEKRFADKLWAAKESGRTLIQPRAGVALVDEHIALLQHLETEGGADLLPSTIDAKTRLNRYDEVQKGIDESIAKGRSMLNGFPAVNHGVALCRKVTSSVKSPIQVRHGTPDARLLAEITIAGGFTSYEGGGISYNIPYSKAYPLEQTLRDWMYIDRLTGMYAEAGIIIDREPFGPLTGTLVPPSISNTVAVLEALLAAEQGVKFLTLGYGQCGNIVQDVAALKSLEKAANFYLNKYGYKDVKICTVLHQLMGGFPEDEARAFGVIALGSTIAALGNATKVIVKTPHEASGIPTKEANANGLKATKQVINMLGAQTPVSDSRVDFETDIIMQEIACMMDKVDELGGGDIALGTVRAFEAGIIDIPFAPSKINYGKMLPARDLDGAIRILNIAELPFSQSLKDFHRDKLEARAKYENREVGFNMVQDDIYAIGNGYLIKR